MEEMLLTLRDNRAVISVSSLPAETRSLSKNHRREDENDLCDDILIDLLVQGIEAEVTSVNSVYESLNVQIQNVDRSFQEREIIYIYDVAIFIRSPLQEHNLRDYVEGGFESDEEKASTVETLRNSGCDMFESVEGFDVVLKEDFDAQQLGSQDGTTDSSDSSSRQTVLIAGTFAALSAGSILMSVYLIVNLSGRRRRGLSSVSMDGNGESSASEEPQQHEIFSEIGVQAADAFDISTLGDPLPSWHRRETAPDEEEIQFEDKTNDSFGVDYDYQRAQAMKCSSDVSEGTDTPHNLLILSTDDDTIDQQYASGEMFEVRAPPGLLGLVLETMEDGVPVVSDVKSTSVLRDEVLVGDRLISVDGIDVVFMLASDVSQIIASKQRKAERVFNFSRAVARKRSMSLDFDSRPPSTIGSTDI